MWCHSFGKGKHPGELYKVVHLLLMKNSIKQAVLFRDLGEIGYQDAWDLQEQLLQENVAVKMEQRKRAAALEEELATGNGQSAFAKASADKSALGIRRYCDPPGGAISFFASGSTNAVGLGVWLSVCSASGVGVLPASTVTSRYIDPPRPVC